MKLFQTQAKQIGLGCVQNLPVIALIFGIVVLLIGVFLGVRWDLVFGIIALNIILILLRIYALSISQHYKYNSSPTEDMIIMSAAYHSSIGILIGVTAIFALTFRWGIDGAVKGALSGVVIGVIIQSIFGLIGAIYGAFEGRFGQATNETLIGGALGALLLFFISAFYYGWDSQFSFVDPWPWIIFGAIAGAGVVIAVKANKSFSIKKMYIDFLVWLGAEPPLSHTTTKHRAVKVKKSVSGLSKDNQDDTMIPEEDLPEWLKEI